MNMFMMGLSTIKSMTRSHVWDNPIPRSYEKHPLSMVPICPNGTWKFPTKKNMVSFRSCLVWTGDGIIPQFETNPSNKLQRTLTHGYVLEHFDKALLVGCFVDIHHLQQGLWTNPSIFGKTPLMSIIEWDNYG